MLQAVNDRFVVKIVAPKPKNGILLPETATETEPLHGEVISVGRGHLTESGEVIPLTVQIGDIVAFPPKGGAKYKDVIVLQENAILGIVRED